MMKHNNNRKIVSNQLFLGIFPDNIKAPPSQTKRLFIVFWASHEIRVNTRYKPDGPAVGVLGSSIPSSRAAAYMG